MKQLRLYDGGYDIAEVITQLHERNLFNEWRDFYRSHMSYVIGGHILIKKKYFDVFFNSKLAVSPHETV